MSHDNFEQLLESSMQNTKLPKVGSIITANVIQITQEDVVVDMSMKSEATISKKEFNPVPQIGDEVKLYVEAVSNNYIKLSYIKAMKQKNFSKLQEAFEQQLLLPGSITKAVDKGFLVQILSWEAFLPYSQATLSFSSLTDEKKKSLVGSSQQFHIIALETTLARPKIIVSIKETLKGLQNEQKAEFFNSIQVGDVLPGRVIVLNPKSVLVELAPSCIGLVKISDISWEHVKAPSDVLQLNQTIPVKILEIDTEKYQILLSIKGAQGNIWEKYAQEHPVHTQVSGTVVIVEERYAIVKVQEGIQGLLHISNVSWENYITNMKNSYKVGQEISVMIIKLDIEKHKIEFGVKQIEGDPWNDFIQNHSLGDKVSGVILRKTEFSMFVEVEKITGLLNKKNISWNVHEQNLNSFHIGDTITVSIISIDKDQRKIGFALKDMSISPWESLASVKEGDTISMTVKNLNEPITLSFNNILEITMLSKQVPRDMHLEVGQKIDVLVTAIDVQKQFLNVSLRDLVLKEQKQSFAQYMSSQSYEEESSPLLGNLLDNFLKKK